MTDDDNVNKRPLVIIGSCSFGNELCHDWQRAPQFCDTGSVGVWICQNLQVPPGPMSWWFSLRMHVDLCVYGSVCVSQLQFAKRAQRPLRGRWAFRKWFLS